MAGWMDARSHALAQVAPIPGLHLQSSPDAPSHRLWTRGSQGGRQPASIRPPSCASRHPYLSDSTPALELRCRCKEWGSSVFESWMPEHQSPPQTPDEVVFVGRGKSRAWRCRFSACLPVCFGQFSILTTTLAVTSLLLCPGCQCLDTHLATALRSMKCARRSRLTLDLGLPTVGHGKRAIHPFRPGGMRRLMLHR